MKKILKFSIYFLIVGLLILFSYLYIKPLMVAYSSLSEEKCNSTQGDDCWHELAHKTFNRDFCNNIIDNETREHCLEHIYQTKGEK